MILGVRKTDIQGLGCLNVFRMKDWLLPIEDLGQTCFAYFDDSVRKLQKDPEATRISVPKLKAEKELTLLNTATATALRSVPEKRRNSVELFSLALFEKKGNRFAWTNLPRWAKIYVEDKSGNIYQLKQDKSPNPNAWIRLEFEADDTFIHLSLFRDHFFSGLGAPDEAVFYRTSSLMNEKRADWTPTWSMPLKYGRFESEFGEDRA